MYQLETTGVGFFFFFNVNTVSPEDIIKSLFSGPEMLQLWVCGPVHEAGHQQA